MHHVEVVQLCYDGTRFEVTERELAGIASPPVAGPGGWQLVAPGLTNAIAAGDDLLQPVTAQHDSKHQSGVCRWRWQDGHWTAAAFVPVCVGSEPSLVRLANRSLLFAARLSGEQVGTILILRSADDGAT